MKLDFSFVTAKRWKDLELLFGERGACGGCWCMYFRLTRKELEAGKGEGNRKALRRLVEEGKVPGILAYHQGRPVGWCSLGPRSEYPTLDRSRILRAVDTAPVWSVVCFFIQREYRRRGVGTALLGAAVGFARSRGATFLEGYPVDPKKPGTPDVFAFTGLASSFLQLGFEEVARRSPTRPIMRLSLDRSHPGFP